MPKVTIEIDVPEGYELIKPYLTSEFVANPFRHNFLHANLTLTVVRSTDSSKAKEKP